MGTPSGCLCVCMSITSSPQLLPEHCPVLGCDVRSHSHEGKPVPEESDRRLWTMRRSWNERSSVKWTQHTVYTMCTACAQHVFDVPCEFLWLQEIFKTVAIVLGHHNHSLCYRVSINMYIHRCMRLWNIGGAHCDSSQNFSMQLFNYALPLKFNLHYHVIFFTKLWLNWQDNCLLIYNQKL